MGSFPIVEVRAVPYGHPDAAALVAAAEAEMVERYGENDANPLAPADFDPPVGGFFVAYVGGQPAGGGGWRTPTVLPDAAELKRMFTVATFRRRGIARALLAALESDARAAGRKRIVLETGTGQPEAIAMYQRLGYERITGYGHYRDHPDALSLGRVL